MNTPPVVGRCFGFQVLPCAVLPLFLVVALPSKTSGASSTLSVPAHDKILNIASGAPPDLETSQLKQWQLVEMPNNGNPIAVDFAPGYQADGTLSATERILVANILPDAKASGRRRFKLVEMRQPDRAGDPAFRWDDMNDKSLGLWEGKRPVLVYNHGVQTKADVPANRYRSTYVHPIYGLDGEVLTDDFPKDHFHHRGLFWGWPHVRIGGMKYDLWDLRGIEQRFERWLHRQTGSAAAILAVENGWYVGDKKVVQERLWLRVYPAQGDAQAIDVDLIWIPLERPVTLAGAAEKSYGGFTLRFAPRTDTVITTPLGNQPEDLAVTRLAWADLSAKFQGAPGPSGAAVFISSEHPDYPPTWLTRHYGALCVGWPGVKPATFEPGEPIRCRYRVWVHRGSPGAEELGAAYRGYESLGKLQWE